jgi:hypothetical protein
MKKVNENYSKTIVIDEETRNEIIKRCNAKNIELSERIMAYFTKLNYLKKSKEDNALETLKFILSLEQK